MAQKSGGATQTRVRPDSDPKAVAADLNGNDDPSIEGIIADEEETAEAAYDAAMSLHDIRDDLKKQLKKTHDDNLAKQGIEAAVTSIEGSIRNLDNVLRRHAARASSLTEAKALGLESSTGEVNSTGRPVSRAITEAASEAKGESHVPGAAGGLTWAEALTPEEIKSKGLEPEDEKG